MNFFGANNQETVIFKHSSDGEIRFLSRGFLPTDLPNLQVWLDAEEGVLNAIGISAELTSIQVSASENVYAEELDEEKNVEGIYNKTPSKVNGRNAYLSNQGDYLYWNGSKWILEVAFDDNGGDFFVYVDSDGQVVDYPWEATWSALGQGGGVTRASPENDTAATNNQTVEQWNNKAPGKPNLQQTIVPSLRPTFVSSFYGRKNVFFNGGHVLHNSNFSNFAQEYSYYFVSTTLFSSGTAIKLTTDSTRGAFGANATNLTVNNVGATSTTNLSRSISNNFGVFSARFNLSAGQVTVGRNLTNEVVTLSDTLSAQTSTVVIGGRRANVVSLNISSRFSEILVYNSFHDNNTAQEIINYLVQKWNINTNL
jgi:hypothetical protein